MCGIAGFFARDGVDRSTAQSLLWAMTSVIRHRGPDDGGVWIDPECGIGLGSRRLAIVDLSADGHQPMRSASGRYVIVYNGEVYNHRELRGELLERGAQFRGHSDTEVLIAAVEAWGLRRALERVNGMYAFALWDSRDHLLHLVRDRLGEKPLYYGFFGKTLVFGSELKSLRVHPDFCGEIDRGALSLYVCHGYIPTPYSIHRNVFKLEPGHTLTIDASLRRAQPLPYWSPEELVERALRNPLRLSADEAEDQLDALLRDAVRLRLRADVPVGAFLSGGVDSSILVAMMQALSPQRVRTFTIGFHEESFDEAAHAAAVARHLGTDHTETFVTPQEAMAVIPTLPAIYDEPFGDYSQIPTILVSKLARSAVTVSLTGDAGDELFGGYERYTWGMRMWRRIWFRPPLVRRVAASVLRSVSQPTWERVLGGMGPLVPRYLHERRARIHSMANVLDADSAERLFEHFGTHWREAPDLVLGAERPPMVLGTPRKWRRIADFPHRMMFIDLMTYLPGDILAKVDRATMSVSLEARIPLLDPRIIEFAWRLPLHMKVRDGEGKWLLRRLLYRYVPRHLVDRPKMGFSAPVGEWLRGPLQEWADELLREDRLQQDGMFDPVPIRRLWREHLSGRLNRQNDLWLVLMFQAWYSESRSAPARPAVPSVPERHLHSVA